MCRSRHGLRPRSNGDGYHFAGPEPQKKSRLVAFALSPALSYTTGSMIAATGGLPA
jgi:hypothetical protein